MVVVSLRNTLNSHDKISSKIALCQLYLCLSALFCAFEMYILWLSSLSSISAPSELVKNLKFVKL